MQAWLDSNLVSIPMIIIASLIVAFVSWLCLRLYDKWRYPNRPKYILAKIAAGKEKPEDRERYVTALRAVQEEDWAKEAWSEAMSNAHAKKNTASCARLQEFQKQVSEFELQSTQSTIRLPARSGAQYEEGVPFEGLSPGLRQQARPTPVSPTRNNTTLRSSLPSSMSGGKPIFSDPAKELAKLGSALRAPTNTRIARTTNPSQRRNEGASSSTTTTIRSFERRENVTSDSGTNERPSPSTATTISEQQRSTTLSSSQGHPISAFSAALRSEPQENETGSNAAQSLGVSKSTTRDNRQLGHPGPDILQLHHQGNGSNRTRTPDHHRSRELNDATAVAAAAAAATPAAVVSRTSLCSDDDNESDHASLYSASDKRNQRV